MRTGDRSARAAGAAAAPGGVRGYALVMVLVLVATVALALLLPVEHALTQSRREREAQLLFVGDQYRRAIERYYIESPGAAQFPARLEDLLEDRRWPVPRRPLRRLYPDPFDAKQPWGLVQHGGGIVGVYSRAAGEPYKRAGFPSRYEAFKDATSYAEWVFFAVPGSEPAPVVQPQTDAPARQSAGD